VESGAIRGKHGTPRVERGVIRDRRDRKARGPATRDREEFHFKGLDACIADVALAVRPTLNVVDASRVMLTGGPRGNGGSRYAELGMQILCPDIVAADAAAAKAFGASPGSFEYIGRAAALKLGTDDLDSLDIRRIVL